MDLQPTGSFGRISLTYLVQPKQFPGRIIELVMIDLVRSKRSVEGELDIRRKRRKFQHFDWECM